MTTYTCKHCQWTGTAPSLSDASTLVEDDEGRLVQDRVHVPVCPLCFNAVRSVRAVQADELRAVLVDIARSAA